MSHPPSYRNNLVACLGGLMNSINSKDDHASFIGTAPVDAFRDSVREVVSETWWNSNLGDATDRPRAKALKDRLISDDRKVGEAWLERRGGSYGRSACLTVFCETVFGATIYHTVLDLGREEEETMHILGKVYGALLQSIAMKNHVLEAPAGFAFINGGPMSTYTRYLLLPIAAIVDILTHDHLTHATQSSGRARAFCRGVEAVLPEDKWDVLSGAAVSAIRERLQEDHVQVAASLPAKGATPKDVFTALLGTVMCELIPPNSEGNDVELGKVYGALLKSLAFPSDAVHAPGGFSYHNGQPMSTPYELAHRRRAAARSPAFFPVARQARTSW
ncbi:hypothetical protein RTBOTA2_005928 [Rhodotorula toruloides]|uniref:Uncharacterized protein n=1 Tax=Rhodotorula toruloides TaxID=5286 RepID=A0A2T0A1V3_RHOTO|nr:hypothetical protein RTBOTA2_005928 [Rhodotorula toruloides]PRQ71982.1 hypothetical protein AAT19DRAFT_9321 [Rhodotorula toruloides]